MFSLEEKCGSWAGETSMSHWVLSLWTKRENESRGRLEHKCHRGKPSQKYQGADMQSHPI